MRAEPIIRQACNKKYICLNLYLGLHWKAWWASCQSKKQRQQVPLLAWEASASMMRCINTTALLHKSAESTQTQCSQLAQKKAHNACPCLVVSRQTQGIYNCIHAVSDLSLRADCCASQPLKTELEASLH